MARYEFKLPDIGEGVTEGEVVTWHVQEGDKVVEDQLMVEVMTDKATVTIGAPRTGKVAELCAEAGKVVQVGDVLLVLESGNGSRATGGHPSKMPASAVGDIQESLPGASYFAARRASDAESGEAAVPASNPMASAAPSATSYYADKPLATPAVRKFAREHNVDLRRVPPARSDQRVTKDDVVAYQHGAGPDAAVVPAPVAKAAVPRSANTGEERRVPFVGMRRKIAERMRLSKDSAAHFTFVEECEADQLLAMRKRLKDDATEKGVQLTFLPFVIKAVVAALKKHPKLNSYLDVERNEIVTPGTYNIGIAASTDQGLVVPVVHHAEQLSLLELAREVQRLGESAKHGRLTVAEMTGSTFTVTSLGKEAGLFAVPIINYPNVGILGIHRIKERPVVRDGQIVIGNVMLLSLSLDHRLVDGHEGAAFAYDVIHYLEDPARLLLDA